MRRVSLSFLKVPKAPQFALSIALIVFTVSLLAGLKADASPMPTQTLSGTITTSQTLNPSIVYVVDNFAVGNGATLTIPAGTIVKLNKYSPVVVQNGGSLRVTGTSANPVHFTSVKDDSLGGDTNGDGTASVPAIDDYRWAVLGNDGDINIVFAKFRYSSDGIEASRTSGNIVITDSTFDDSHTAISAHGPTVKLYRNKFNNLSPNSMQGAVQVSKSQDLTKISLSGIDQNVFTGSNKFSRIISLGEVTLPAGKAWTAASSSGATVYFGDKNYINGTLTMSTDTSMITESSSRVSLEVNGVLNLQSGVWVKRNYGTQMNAMPGGTINVAGTSSNPVRFTDIKDDTVGGDTNGDGTASTPDPNGGAIVINGAGGSLSIAGAKFSHSYQSIVGDFNSISVVDSNFEKSSIAILVTRASQLTLKRNNFVMSPGGHENSVYLSKAADISGMSFSGPDHNTFVGNQYQRTVSIDGSALPSGKTFDITTEGGGIPKLVGGAVILEGVLNIQSNAIMIISGSPTWDSAAQLKGTMNIYSGAVIKYTDSQGLAVAQGANLNVYGTAASKVNFTSMTDDSVGGDTNSDGNGSAPIMGEIGAMIHMGGGNVTINHTEFKYASRGIIGQSDGGSLKVFDSVFQNGYKAIEAKVSNVKIYRNTFDVTPYKNQSALELSGVSDMSRVGFSGPDQNFFTGPTPASKLAQFYESDLPAGRTLIVSSSSGGSLRLGGDDINIDGTLTMSQGTVLVLEGGRYTPITPKVRGTLNIQQGTVVKMFSTAGVGIFDQGKVNISGSTTSKVRITHLYDDSIGGDTYGDGNETVVDTNPYVAFTAFEVAQGGSLTASNVDVSYAGRVINQSGGYVSIDGMRTLGSLGTFSGHFQGEATFKNTEINGASDVAIRVGDAALIFRGKLTNLQNMAIQACNWTQSCSVDAAYVDWGTGGAPTTGSVCGQVTVSPWANGSASSDGLFTSKNCDNSPTPADQLASSTQHFGQRMSTRGIDCGNGFEDACEAMRRAQTCLGEAVNVAGSTSPFPLPGAAPHEQANTWGASLADGATTYIQAIESPTPQLSALQFGNKLLGALNTMISISSAYGSCAP